MIKKLLSQVVIFTFILSTPTFALTKLFYALRDSDTPNLRDHYRVLADIEKHHDKIDILVPQAYVINHEGRVYKFVESGFEKTARHYHIKLMPLVTNENFNSKKVDQFLNDPKAQSLAISTLTRLCKTKRYYGFQMDFEHVPARDRDAYTQFFTNTANALYAVNCKISVAIVPQRRDIPPSKLLLNRDEYWAGAYDQKRLSGASDFVVLMTYNQSGGMTTPGPTATVPVDKKALEFALKHIPRQKIFLGIPTTSIYWEMTPIQEVFKHGRVTFDEQSVSSIVAHGIGISYEQALLLQRMHHLKWQRDDYAEANYAVFHYHDFYHYLFLSDVTSIAAQRKLAKQYHIRGIAVFRLGNEDSEMWKKFTKKNA